MPARKAKGKKYKPKKYKPKKYKPKKKVKAVKSSKRKKKGY